MDGKEILRWIFAALFALAAAGSLIVMLAALVSIDFGGVATGLIAALVNGLIAWLLKPGK